VSNRAIARTLDTYFKSGDRLHYARQSRRGTHEARPRPDAQQLPVRLGHHDSTSIGDAASVGSAMEAGFASASGIGAAEACDGSTARNRDPCLLGRPGAGNAGAQVMDCASAPTKGRRVVAPKPSRRSAEPRRAGGKGRRSYLQATQGVPVSTIGPRFIKRSEKLTKPATKLQIARYYSLAENGVANLLGGSAMSARAPENYDQENYGHFLCHGVSQFRLP
jgi:hypothetical protein